MNGLSWNLVVLILASCQLVFGAPELRTKRADAVAAADDNSLSPITSQVSDLHCFFRTDFCVYF